MEGGFVDYFGTIIQLLWHLEEQGMVLIDRIFIRKVGTIAQLKNGPNNSNQVFSKLKYGYLIRTILNFVQTWIR